MRGGLRFLVGVLVVVAWIVLRPAAVTAVAAPPQGMPVTAGHGPAAEIGAMAEAIGRSAPVQHPEADAGTTTRRPDQPPRELREIRVVDGRGQPIAWAEVARGPIYR